MVAARSVLIGTGVFKFDIRDWDKKPAADKTWANFREFFTEANKDRIKDMPASQLQHQAFTAITQRTGSPDPRFSPSFSPITIDSGGGSSPMQFSYCWTHGLTTNVQHTSKTCSRKASGHQEDATLDNMLGGNNTIRRKRGEKDKYRQLNPPRTNRDDRNRDDPNRDDRNNRNRANLANEHDADTVATSNSSVTDSTNPVPRQE